LDIIVFRILATNIKCSCPHYKFTWTFQMSVQFLEAWVCQRHNLREPVVGDGVLLMIVVPRRFTPCEQQQHCLLGHRHLTVHHPSSKM